MLRARLELWRRSWNVMKIPLPPKRRCQKSSRSHPPTALSGTRPRYLGLLANNLNVRQRFAQYAVITLRVFMATMNYDDTLTAITRLIAGCGFAKTIQQTVVLALLYLSPTAKHVATTRHMARTTTLPPTFDVHISILARTSEEVAEKSAKDAAEWEVEKNLPWTS
jgi:hypothetical protein